MLDLRSSNKILSHYRDGFVDETMPAEVSRDAFARFDATQYDAETLEYGRANWQHRALDEYRSQVGFTEFLCEITMLGLASDALGACTRVVRDEVRHVELCRRMVGALGGSEQMPGTPSYVFSDKSLDPAARVLDTVVSSLCVGETLSVRLMTVQRSYITDPLAHAALTALAADESFHSRFGWSMLDLLLPYAPAADRQRIAERMPALFRVVEEMLVQPEEGDKRFGREPNPFGYMAPSVRSAAFYDCMERVIIKNFEERGLPARQAWNKRKSA
jgi:hypothetical protein